MVVRLNGGVESEGGRCGWSAVADRLEHGFVQKSHNEGNSNGYARERLHESGRL